MAYYAVFGATNSAHNQVIKLIAAEPVNNSDTAFKIHPRSVGPGKMPKACVSNYSSLTSAYIEDAEQMCNEQLRSVKLKKRTDFSYLKTELETKEHDGEEVFQLFVWLVEYGLHYRFHYFQKKFFECVLQVVAEYLLGDRWAEVSAHYRAKYNWGRMSRVAFAVAARRFGKTVTAGQVQAALALVKPTAIVTLSTGKRASDGLRAAVLGCLYKSNYGHLLGRSVKGEKIEVQTLLFPEQKSSLRFLPASPLVRGTASRASRCPGIGHTIFARYV